MPHVRRRMLISLSRTASGRPRASSSDTLGLTPADDAAPGDGPLCGAAAGSGAPPALRERAPTGDGGTDVVIGRARGGPLQMPYFGWFVTAITWIAARSRPARRRRPAARPASTGTEMPPRPASLPLLPPVGLHRRGGRPPRRPCRGGGPGELLRCPADPELGRGDHMRSTSPTRTSDSRSRSPGPACSSRSSSASLSDRLGRRRLILASLIGACASRTRCAAFAPSFEVFTGVAAVRSRVRERDPGRRGDRGRRGGAGGCPRLRDVDVRPRVRRRRRRSRSCCSRSPTSATTDGGFVRRSARWRSWPIRSSARHLRETEPVQPRSRNAHEAARPVPGDLRPHLQAPVRSPRARGVPHQCVQRAVVAAHEPLPAPIARVLQLRSRRPPIRHRGRARAHRRPARGPARREPRPAAGHDHRYRVGVGVPDGVLPGRRARPVDRADVRDRRRRVRRARARNARQRALPHRGRAARRTASSSSARSPARPPDSCSRRTWRTSSAGSGPAIALCGIAPLLATVVRHPPPARDRDEAARRHQPVGGLSGLPGSPARPGCPDGGFRSRTPPRRRRRPCRQSCRRHRRARR